MKFDGTVMHYGEKHQNLLIITNKRDKLKSTV